MVVRFSDGRNCRLDCMMIEKGFPVEETVSLSSGSPNSSVSVEGDVRKTVTRVVGRKFAEVLIAAARGGTGRLPDRRSRPSRRFPRSPCYARSEEQTSELQALMRISYAVFCLKKKK